MNIEIQNRTQTTPHHNCLNCNNVVENNFCSVCGQKASTHRYSLEHFFVHDLVHGVFHFDKGFFYTLKELFTRPGHSIREFVAGKRVNHFNYFSFALLILIIDHYVQGFSSVKIVDFNKASGYYKLAKDYYKILPFVGIPILALVSYLIFKGSKQNYTEHLIINFYRVSMLRIIMLIFNIISVFYSDKESLHTLYKTIFLIDMAYSSWFFYQYFSVFDYNKKWLIFRCIMTGILLVSINNGLVNQVVDEVGKHFFK